MSYDSIGKWEKYLQKQSKQKKNDKFKNKIISKHLKKKSPAKKRSKSQ